MDAKIKRKILIVDDEPTMLSMLASLLGRDYFVHTALGGVEALEIADRQGPHAVVMADMRMPGMSGVELLSRMREKHPDTVRVLTSGLMERQIAIDAVNKAQVYRMLSKPCSPVELEQTIGAAVGRYEAHEAEKELFEQTVNGGVQMLVDLLARVSHQSFGRAQILRQAMRQVASYLDLTDTRELEALAMVARVGELGLPGGLLAKAQGRQELARDERELWERVPEFGSKLLSNVPRLESLAKDVLYQSKNFDGSGFPGDLLAGKGIPLAARILRGVTDFQLGLEAGRSPSQQMAELRNMTGIYDPEVLSAINAGLVAHATARPGVTRVACNLRDLRVGQRLAEPVVTLDQMLLFQRGLVITEVMLDRMRKFQHEAGLRQPLYVEDTHVVTPP